MERLTEKDWDSVKGTVFDAVRRLQEIENILGDTYDLDRLRELVKADKQGLIAKMPFVAMIEQSLKGGEMKPKTDQRFNGRYAVVYFDKEKWGCPLIDICGAPYNGGEAEERRKKLAKEDDHE